MSSVKLYSEGVLSITGISNVFLDKYMPEANGEFVKVYLYLVRCMGDSSKQCSVSAIADHLNHTETDVQRALLYWERQNVLRLDFDAQKNIVGIGLLPLYDSAPASVPTSAPAAIQASAPVAIQTPAPAAEQIESKRRSYTIDEIESFRKDDEVSEMFFVIETYLKKPMTVAQINTVLFWYEELEFSTDLITHLVEYCLGKGHNSFRYMDRIALDWYNNSIFTIEAAKCEAEKHNKVNYTIIKALGISGRDLAQSERVFITRWTEEWKFELPLIEEACRRTIEATHQASFTYADKILETWKNNGVRNMDDVIALDQSFAANRKISVRTTESTKRTKFSNFDARNNDYDQLEQMLVKTTVQ